VTEIARRDRQNRRSVVVGERTLVQRHLRDPVQDERGAQQRREPRIGFERLHVAVDTHESGSLQSDHADVRADVDHPVALSQQAAQHEADARIHVAEIENVATDMLLGEDDQPIAGAQVRQRELFAHGEEAKRQRVNHRRVPLGERIPMQHPRHEVAQQAHRQRPRDRLDRAPQRHLPKLSGARATDQTGGPDVDRRPTT
jgi:hypothetical protein